MNADERDRLAELRRTRTQARELFARDMREIRAIQGKNRTQISELGAFVQQVYERAMRPR